MSVARLPRIIHGPLMGIADTRWIAARPPAVPSARLNKSLRTMRKIHRKKWRAA
jgi:hypothetical protein